MIDSADARAITIPVCMLASKDEDVEEVRRWDEALVVKEKRVEVFGDQVHGWMSARAKLGEAKSREGYERGYRIFLEFFGRYL
jgi:dienelactone hydrolase